MKNIERGSIKHLLVLIIVTALCGMAFYPLLDLIVCKLFTHSDFAYSVYNHLIQPIIFSIVFGTTFWIAEKKSTK